MKRHGFSLPLHPLQVTGWVGVGAVGVGFYLLQLPLLVVAMQAMTGVLFTSLLIVTLAFCLACTLSDSSDPTVEAEREALAQQKAFDSEKYSLQCPICETHVLERTKHCMMCKRCILEFDHHCKWLNNCIGKNNYRYFLGLITALELLMCTTIAAGLATTVAAFTNTETQDKIRDLFKCEELMGYYVANLGVVTLAGLVAVFNGNLVVLHLYLKLKGISSSDFMLARRERQGKVVDTSDQTYQVAVGGSPDKLFSEEASSRMPNPFTSNSGQVLSGGSSFLPMLPER
jgi:palmitoyltransferase